MAEMKRRERNQSLTARADLSIELYVHVVTTPKGKAYHLNYDTIYQQISVLNENFGPGGFTFWLKDIDWSFDPYWAVGLLESHMKRVLHRGENKTANLYILDIVPDGLGICSFPWDLEDPERGPLQDGCMIEASTLPGGKKVHYNQGKTAVHEMGHWLGLLHTFHDGCVGDGDHIDDTPATDRPAYRCPVGRDSCVDQPGLDPVHNFMDFSYE
ncbi:hypothetical protein CP533_4887 [Ophiocordyceps camponoti-saundersi (nom. inval.)]|nr:hypothetical protein CP533_4887 [Ophiocordyceps camponoti-saundersi (nom. inval.)]